MRDARKVPDELAHEALDLRLDHFGRFLDARVLGFQRRVAAAPRDKAAIGELPPVIEATARIVRAGKEEVRERLGRDHLSPRGLHGRLELRQQPLAVAVGRDHHVGRVQVVQGPDAAVLVDLGAGFSRKRRQAAHPPRGLQRSVAGVADRSRETTSECRWQFVEPIRLEAILTERFVLRAELVTLGLVPRQPKAADTAEGVARKLRRPADVALRQPPETQRGLASELPTCLAIGHCAPAEREAAVAAARAARDLARLVQMRADTALRQRERTCAAGDSASDHDRVGSLRLVRRRERRR